MNQDFDFFTIRGKFRTPQTGKILVSEPFLLDDNFHRSVVLLTEHNEKGDLGFILNKPIEAPIYEIVNDFPEKDFNVSVGGPVATDTLHFIHTLGDKIPDSHHILHDLYWGGDFGAIKQMINLGTITTDQIRFFVGYSGWGKGQLAREISENAWIVTEAPTETIMLKPNPEIWKDVLRDLGGKYSLWPDFPENPGHN